MKKSLFLTLVLTCVLTMLSAAKLSDYKPLDKSRQSRVVYNQAFEDKKPPKGFRLQSGFEWKRGYGENGNGGLVYRRPEPNGNYTFISVDMPQLKPGKRYCLEYMTSVSGVKDHRGVSNCRAQLIGFDFTDKKTGKYLHSSYHKLKVVNGQLPWTSFKFEFSVPDNGKTQLCFFLKRKELTCKEVRWDNVQITELGDEPPIIYPLAPTHLALKDNDTLKLRVANFIQNTGKLQLFAVMPDGRELSGVVENGEAKIKVGKLSGKAGEIKFLLCDDKNKSVLGETVYPFTFNAETPENYVKTDATGRVFVNGKPFFPVGMFLEIPEGTQEKYDHMKRMGINTVLQYHNFELRLPEKRGKSTLAKLRRSLDIMDKTGLKFCFCLTELTGRLGNVTSFDGVNGRNDILKYVVNGLKDHPAMLGWYVSDENQVADLGPVKDMRFTISQNDPFHPVLTLTNIKNNFTAFGPTGDVMMYDNYPVKDETTQDMLQIREGIVMERINCRMGLWWVPQIFNWAIYPGVFPMTYQQMRWPSEEEMRSQSLLALNYRVRGIIFYAYESVGKHDRYVPGDSKKLWPIVERTVRFTADLEPWFLADKKPLKLKVANNGKSKVEAKLHVANDGRKIVVITALGPGRSDAVITLPKGNFTKLKSRFGKTEALVGGKYHFKGMNVSSDILE